MIFLLDIKILIKYHKSYKLESHHHSHQNYFCSCNPSIKSIPTTPATSPSTSIYSLPQFVYLFDKNSFKYFSQFSDFAIIIYMIILDFERYCSADIAQDYCFIPEAYFIFRHRFSNDFERSIERRARVPVKQILIIQLKADGSLVLLNYLEQIEPSFLNYYFSPLIQYARHRISYIFIV